MVKCKSLEDNKKKHQQRPTAHLFVKYILSITGTVIQLCYSTFNCTQLSMCSTCNETANSKYWRYILTMGQRLATSGLNLVQWIPEVKGKDKKKLSECRRNDTHIFQSNLHTSVPTSIPKILPRAMVKFHNGADAAMIRKTPTQTRLKKHCHSVQISDHQRFQVETVASLPNNPLKTQEGRQSSVTKQPCKIGKTGQTESS